MLQGCCALAACLGGVAYAADDLCERVIALSPSLVEVVAELGLESRLVGVSRFTRYPDSARQLAQVGGLLDPNLEAIIARKPSLVLGLNEHGDLIRKLQKLGVKSEILDHRRISGIMESITRIGSWCQITPRADTVRGELQKILDRARRSVLGKKKSRALVLIGGKQDALTLGNLYVSGRDGFYADLLDLSGAENVFHGLTGAFTGVSREALIRQDPEFIFHIVSGDALSDTERRAILAAWHSLPYLKAVKGNQVFVLGDYADSIPGPRFPLVLEKFYRALHQGASLP